MEPNLNLLAPNSLITGTAGMALLTQASELPGPFRESLRERCVVHRFVDHDGRWLCQLHMLFWHAPVVEPRPGLHARGVELPIGFAARCIGRIGDHHVFVGRPGDLQVRQVASRLHLAMIREGGYLASPISVEPDEHDYEINNHVFLVATEDGRAIGYASTGKASGMLLACHVDGQGLIKSRCQFRPIPTGPHYAEVETVWVAPEHRGRGISAGLFRLIAQHFKVRPMDLSYRAPFTPGGLALIRKVAGPLFAATGEIAVLMHPLDAPSDLFEPDDTFDVAFTGLAAAGSGAGHP